LCEGISIAVFRCGMGTWVSGFWDALGSNCFLMRATAADNPFNVVDLYDSGTGLWSTARLSQARQLLSATSVGTVAIFAGGLSTSKFLSFFVVVVVVVV
jgi:hypothetical protein